MSKYTRHSFFPFPWKSEEVTPQSHGSAFVEALCKATWDYIVCLFKPLQTACSVAFCSKCASIHCSEIDRSWIFPKHVTTPSHMTENHNQRFTKHRARGITMTSWGMQGHCPFPSCPKPALFSSHLSLISSMSLGCRLGEVSRCDGNTEPHSEEKATGQGGVKDLHRVHIFTVCSDLQPYPTQSRFRTEDFSTFNRTVRCLQSRQVFLEGSQTWMSSRWFRELAPTGICDCDLNF